MTGQAGFFDVDERLQRLSDLGDQLEAYAATVDFEIFRAPLEAALAYADGVKAGRPAYDAVMMFKILLIQAQNNLSDDRTEFLINDRLSFMRFLGLSLGERVSGRQDDLAVPRTTDPRRGLTASTRPCARPATLPCRVRSWTRA
jgi:transposase, IS5 family